MKNKIVALLLIINIVLIGIVYNLLNPNERLAGEKQILKEMSTTEREQELDNKITELSTSATEYATYVQSCKTQIANAITERGVTTNEMDTVDVIVENIKKLGSLSDIQPYLYTYTGDISNNSTKDISYTGLDSESLYIFIRCSVNLNETLGNNELTTGTLVKAFRNDNSSIVIFAFPDANGNLYFKNTAEGSWSSIVLLYELSL